MNAISRFVTFTREVYAPGLHAAFAGAWFVALAETLLGTAPGVASLGLRESTLLGAASVFLMLFFLRIVDEWKDLDYDRVHNPERPLVRGLVSKADLARYLVVVAALVFALQLRFGSRLLVGATAAELGWAVVLVALEQRSRVVREHVLVNLLVTYPVNIGISLYVWLWVIEQRTAVHPLGAALVVVGFALAFLVFELARKTAWPEAANPGERLYSAYLGPRCAIAAVFGCALGAGAALIAAAPRRSTADLLLVVPLAATAAIVVRFVRARGQRVSLRFSGILFLGAFYGALILRAWFPR